MANVSELALLDALIARLESILDRLEALELDDNVHPSATIATPIDYQGQDLRSSGKALPSLVAFDCVLDSRVRAVISCANKIGGEVLQVSKLLVDAFAAERTVIEAICKCKQPNEEYLRKLIQPLAGVIVKANSLANTKRSESYNHVKTVADSLQALTWVLYTPDNGMSPPATHVEENWQAAEFYSNKILKKHRHSNSDHTDWAKSMKELYLSGLKGYVLKFHIKGPVWNKDGIDIGGFTCTDVSPVPAVTKVSPNTNPVKGVDALLNVVESKPSVSPSTEVLDDAVKIALSAIAPSESAQLSPSKTVISVSKTSIGLPFKEFKKEEPSLASILSSDLSVPAGEKGEEKANGQGVYTSVKFKKLREHSADRSCRSGTSFFSRCCGRQN